MMPLLLAWMGPRPPRPVLDEIASGAGMLAFSIILVEFILSGRFRSVSGKVGLDVSMRFHQLFARTALVLVLFHPFLYSTPFAHPLPWDTTRQLTLTTNSSALASGAVAWVLVFAFVGMSIGRDQLPYKYETWRLMHGLGAVLISGFALDHTLRAGRYAEDPILAGLWIAFFAIAVLSLIHVYGIKPLMQFRQPWVVESVRALATRTWELSLRPNGHQGLNYEAGQFVWLNIGNSPFSLHEHPFSISSAPSPGKNLEFVIKELGDFTRTIGTIKKGTKACLDGPHGHLVVSGRTEPGIALIAGGVGIAPLIGILRQLQFDHDDRPTLLIYGNRNETQIAYDEELEFLSSSHGTKLVHVLSEPPEDWSGETGLIDESLIRKVIATPEMKTWLYVLCGPPIMMDIVEDALIAKGVSPHQILSERFKYD